MTTPELKTISAISEVWNAFLQLPMIHPDDQNEFRFHIHALQNMILAREGIRVLSSIELTNTGKDLNDIAAPSFIEGGIVKGNPNGMI
jgi:hypothetical protein